MNRIRSMIAGTALVVALSTAVPAIAATYETSVVTTPVSTLSVVSVLYADWISSWTAALNTFGAQNTAWSKVDLSSISSIVTQFYTSDYSLSGTFVYIAGSTAATFTSITAVPGPIVAAGLPGLMALVGFGLYRRRQLAA